MVLRRNLPADPRIPRERDALLALAVDLIGDEHAAEDAVQQTLVTALVSKRRHRGSFRSWAARALHRRVRVVRALDRSRRAREEDAARSSESAPADAPLSAVELQRRVHDAIAALHPKYARVVHLRYFEGLAPRAIAEREALPLRTVNTRLYRALGRLRARLDDGVRGDRSAWVLALAAWRRGDRAGRASRPRALLPARRRAAGVAAVAAGALLATWAVLASRGAPPSGDAAPALPAGALARTRVQPEPSAASGGGGAAPARAAADRRVAVPAPPVAAEAPRWRGRVATPEGEPLAGVTVGLTGDLEAFRTGLPPEEAQRGAPEPPSPLAGPTCVSDDRGRVELPVPVSTRWAVVVDREYATLVAAAAGPLRPLSGATLVAAPRRALTGRVVDAAGLAVEGVRVGLHLALPRPTSSGAHPTQAIVVPSSRTDADGRFELPGAAPVPRSRLVARKAGWSTTRRTLAAADWEVGAELRLALERADDATVRLAGEVATAGGVGLAGAIVRVGTATARCDATGAFELALAELEPGVALAAYAEGYQPVEVELFGAAADGPSASALAETYCYVTLGEPSLAIEGTVVDADGRACEGCRLWIADPEPIGAVDGEACLAEAVMRGEPDGTWVSTATDASGRFRLEGLRAQRYRLRAVRPSDLLMVVHGQVEAGERDVRVVLPADGFFPRVAGRVVDADGRARAGVVVTSALHAFTLSFPGRERDVLVAGDRRAVTDAEGRFELTGLSRRGSVLDYGGPGIVPGAVRLDRVADPAELTVVAARSCELELGPELHALGADEFSVRDADGADLFVAGDPASGWFLAQFVRLDGAEGRVYRASEHARTLVLYRERAELLRLDVRLAPDRRTRIELPADAVLALRSPGTSPR